MKNETGILERRSTTGLEHLITEEIERAVLLLLLTYPEHVGSARNAGMIPEHFGNVACRSIYAAMIDEWTGSVPMLRQMVWDRKGNQASQETITKIVSMQDVISIYTLPTYVARIRDAYVAREIERTASRICIAAQESNGTARELISRALADFGKIETESRDADWVHAGDLDPLFSVMDELRASGGGMLGVPTGFRSVDKITMGLKPSELVILAARPSVGKSALACNIAANVAIRGGGTVAFFSLEMGSMDLQRRIVSSESCVSYSMIQSGMMEASDWKPLLAQLNAIKQAPLYICDKGGITIAEIEAKASALRAKQGRLDLVIVDYLQLVRGSADGMSPYERVSEVSADLKRLAKSLNCCVLSLAQLRRLGDNAAKRQPEMSDLRDSGTIEQDADMIFLMHRDDYYDPNSTEKGITNLNIAKNRNGQSETVQLRHRLAIQQFDEPQSWNPRVWA